MTAARVGDRMAARAFAQAGSLLRDFPPPSPPDQATADRTSPPHEVTPLAEYPITSELEHNGTRYAIAESIFADAQAEVVASTDPAADTDQDHVVGRVRSLPTLLTASGLLQTVAFLQAKAAGNVEAPDARILQALAEIAYVNPLDVTTLDQLSGEDPVSYRRTARRVQLAAHWLKRGIESLGGVDV